MISFKEFPSLQNIKFSDKRTNPKPDKALLKKLRGYNPQKKVVVKDREGVYRMA